MISYYSSIPLVRRLIDFKSDTHGRTFGGENYLKFVELSLSARLKDEVFRSIIDLEKALAQNSSKNEIQLAMVKLNKQNSIIDLHSVSGIFINERIKRSSFDNFAGICIHRCP